MLTISSETTIMTSSLLSSLSSGHVHFARIVCIASALCSVVALVMLLLFGNKAQRKTYLNVAYGLALLAGMNKKFSHSS